MIVYLAGPIRAVGRAAAASWRNKLRQGLEDVGISTFCPVSAWLVVGGDCADVGSLVQLVDDVAVAVCDVMVVACTLHESGGTDHEIKLALALDKPIVVYSFLPEALAEAWARERGLHDAPIMRDQDALVDILEKWMLAWRLD